MKNFYLLILIVIFMFSSGIFAEIKINDNARLFKLNTQDNKEFSLDSRKGVWTVLYFYPKAETPGCTKEACSFRDNIKKIRSLNADVFGISINSVKDQAEFAKNHQLNFTLLADEKGEVTGLYEAKMPILNMAKRWTLIIDPNLIIRDVYKDVDPVMDSERVANRILELQKK